MYQYNLFDSAIKLKVILANYALVLLNTPIKIEPDHFLPMWNQAQYRVCVDEGSMNLINYAKVHNICMDDVYPHLLSGDFRSLTAEMLKEFEAHNVTVVPTVDDDLTNFTKSLFEIAKRNDKIDSVIAIVEPTGRLDHTFANLNTLTLGKNIFGRHVDIFLMNKNSISWIIHRGISIIQVPEWLRNNSCGILPFAPRTSTVTTTGLRWNLNGQVIGFGGLLSTSNKLANDSVTIMTDTPLIWTMIVNKEDLYSDSCRKQQKFIPVIHEPQTAV